MQGSGKGTQSARLQKDFGVTHLSSGDLLRRNITEKTLLGQQARHYVTEGKLFPDELLIDLIDTELLNVGNTVCINSLHIYIYIRIYIYNTYDIKEDQIITQNWFLDGFPRTVGQAKALDATLNRLAQPLNLIINLQVPNNNNS